MYYATPGTKVDSLVPSKDKPLVPKFGTPGTRVESMVPTPTALLAAMLALETQVLTPAELRAELLGDDKAPMMCPAGARAVPRGKRGNSRTSGRSARLA